MIRQAQIKDLERIADVHICCFPNSFSTAIGKNLLTKYYKEYLLNYKSLFLVYEEDEIKGFCCGYVFDGKNIQKTWMTKNVILIAFRTLWLVLKRNEITLKKIKNIFSKNKEKDKNVEIINKDDCFDLLSICVLPEARGNGSAQNLMNEFLKEGKRLGKKCCYLTAEIENTRAISFYKRNGFNEYSKNTKSIKFQKNI